MMIIQIVGHHHARLVLIPAQTVAGMFFDVAGMFYTTTLQPRNASKCF